MQGTRCDVRHRREPARGWLLEVVIDVIKGARHIAGLAASFDFFVIGNEDFSLESFAHIRIDGMRDIGMQLGAPVAVAAHTMLVEACAAAVAVAGTEMVLLVTATAMIAEFSRRHGEKDPVIALDEFDVANNERVIERDRAKSP